MRVLTISEGFPWKLEPQRYVFVWRQMQALIEFGHEFRVLRMVPRAPGLTERWRLYRGVPERYVYQGQTVRIARAFVPPRMYGLGWVRNQVARAIAQEIAAFEPDVIHAHSILVAGYLAMERGRPMVLTAHGSDAYSLPYARPGLLRAARRVVASASEVMAVSSFIARHVEAMGKTATVVFNGADERRFFPRDRARSRDALRIGRDRFVVAFVANLKAAKGTREAALALRAIADLSPVALIAGTGTERRRMEAQLADMEVRFLGNVDHEVLADVYGACDTLMLPSYAEGLPVVICEAMLSGRVAIATPVGGVPELLQDGVNGILVPRKNVAALAGALRRVHDDAMLRARIEAAAAASGEARVTWRKNAQATQAVYERAVAGYRRG